MIKRVLRKVARKKKTGAKKKTTARKKRTVRASQVAKRIIRAITMPLPGYSDPNSFGLGSRTRRRPWLSAEPRRRIAYYSMGSIALAIALFFLVVQSIREIPARGPAEMRSLPTRSKHSNSTSQQKDASRATLDQAFLETKKLKLGERIGYWSEFIEKSSSNRYLLADLVKGHEIEDSVPIVPNQFDCTTYIETVAALARSEGPSEFFKNLMAIRYLNGNPTYATRNHFPEVDWIPNNERAQILDDITESTAQSRGLVARMEMKKIDRQKWLQSQVSSRSVSRGLASVVEKKWGGPTDAEVPYIELSDAQKVIHEIPNGTVINLVRKNDSKHPVLISHQGFVIREGNRILLRHATRSGKIRTSSLAGYLNRQIANNNDNQRWPVIGVNLNLLR